MKNSNFAIVGMITGILYMCLAGWWFYFQHPDIDKLITNMIIGASWFGVWVNYNKNLLFNKKLRFIDDAMEEIIRDQQNEK